MVGSKYSYETGNGVGGRKTFGDSDETVPASPLPDTLVVL